MEKTFGQKAVKAPFNTTSEADVNKAQMLSAELIDLIELKNKQLQEEGKQVGLFQYLELLLLTL